MGESGRDRPLADRLRPASIRDVVGQDHVLGPQGPLGRMLGSGRLSSLILWGPPGTGKTTIARLLSQSVNLHFEQLSAIFSGVQELRKVFDLARSRRIGGKGTLLFVDEIHRFNRAQQDSFLPVMEDGMITLVGATTENPSFELNAALLSRAQVVVLNRLSAADLTLILDRAERAEGRSLPVTPDGKMALVAMADGDGRFLLNLAEELFALRPGGHLLGAAELAVTLHKRAAIYDKGREGHYNLVSALHKAVRGSDPDAALYWLARMLAGGEDPLFIARRLVRMAVEDIGLADPHALVQAMAARDAFMFLGAPEGELALAQAAVYLATAPKSVSVYKALKHAREVADRTGSLSPPLHILNAPTGLMKELGYGKGYVYEPDTELGVSLQSFFPAELGQQTFYEPGGQGEEAGIAARLAGWAALRAASGRKA